MCVCIHQMTFIEKLEKKYCQCYDYKHFGGGIYFQTHMLLSDKLLAKVETIAVDLKQTCSSIYIICIYI